MRKLTNLTMFLRQNMRYLIPEIVIRLILLIVFIITDFMEPFHRVIHKEELWLYKNPKTDSYFTVTILWSFVIFIPLSVFILFLIRRRDIIDFMQAMLAMSLAACINGVTTNALKLAVGRPRPDFFYRCFPDGIYVENMECTGNKDIINDGRKSFPSGHSSWAFVTFGFVAFYIAGKLQTFNNQKNGNSLRCVAVWIPLLTATLIAVSRTADYHHHWQDVTVGSLIGLFVAYIVYRLYYPPLNHKDCDTPYFSFSNNDRYRKDADRTDERYRKDKDRIDDRFQNVTARVEDV